VLGQDLTLRAPVIGRRPNLADYRAFAGAPDRFNFAPFNLIQIPLERYGGFVNVTQEFGNDIEPQRARALQPPRIRATRRRRCRCSSARRRQRQSARHHLDRRHQPVQPVRSDARTRHLQFHRPPRRRERAAPLRPAVDTFYVAAPSTARSRCSARLVLGRQRLWGRTRPSRTVHGNINAANLARALGPVAACTAPCVPFNIFGGDGSITQAMLDYVAFTQRRQQRAGLWDFSAELSGGLFELPGGPAGSPRRRASRPVGQFDPDPIVAAGLGSDIPALPTAAAIMSTRLSPTCGCRCSPTPTSSTASS
jgi:iron complex outermembrane receptor protein